MARRAWQFVGIALALAVLGWLVATLQVVVVGALLGLLIAAMMGPLVQWLNRHGWRRSFAAFGVTVAWLLLVAGVFWLLGQQLVEQAPMLRAELNRAVDRLAEQFPDLPIPTSASPADLVDSTEGQRAVDGLRVGAEILSSFALAVVLSFFMLRDGPRMWEWFVALWDRGHRRRVDLMGRAAYSTVAEYVRGLAVVAAMEATLSGIALFSLGVPLASALTAMTFIGAFVPVLGAIVVGALATALAFAAGGTTLALIVLGIFVGIQQLESNVLQPWIMGHRLPLHPAAVLLALSIGGVVAGIIGALIGIPVAAATVAALRVHVLGHEEAEGEADVRTA
jgi:predicted PurR-regulated permease PerM